MTTWLLQETFLLEKGRIFSCFMANMQCTALAGWRKPSLEILTVMQKSAEIEVHLHFQECQATLSFVLNEKI